MSVDHLQKVGSVSDANFPKDAEGRVYHLGVKRGEVANRVLSVGDPRRAQLISTFLDNPEKMYVRTSNRGFIVYTGTKDNVPISIIATGMGYPMIDFVVRETRAIVDGPMLFIRLGTCGALKEGIEMGNILVSGKGSVFVQRNPDAFGESGTGEHYLISKPIPADVELSENLEAAIQKRSIKSVNVLNATGDTFYASQGRKDVNFEDHNENVIQNVLDRNDVGCFEMETFQLLDLARSSRGSVRATAATIAIAHRLSNGFLDNETIRHLEKEAGQACLDTLINFPLDPKELMKGPECVWN